ncbi:MAG: glutamine--fructose-6-phosphate transaminase (isomerizing) [Elusimicrobia bacterium]|nr:glutamine--fructose-6-phosphate transaminase (isomerizing) [Elusimicrobiota bacterium]
MCGIIGYTGTKEATPMLLEGLRRLEYRGYDSAGVAIVQEKTLSLVRSLGKLQGLEAKILRAPLRGSTGLGHTRWATHGKPSENNAHPHVDCGGALAVVHNGIIENHGSLKARLAGCGHGFNSQTDTEVVAHLIEEELKGLPSPDSPAKASETLLQALRQAVAQLDGAFALAVIWSQAPGCIAAAKSASPLVVGLGEGENFLASDVPAFLRYTRRVAFLDDGELALMTPSSCLFFGSDGAPIEKIATAIGWDHAVAEKAGFPHFMLKETLEQPRTVENTLRGRLFPLDDGILLREAGLPNELLRQVSRIHLVACGTAYHAAIVGKYLLERHARIPAQAETASEYRYRDPLIDANTLVVAVSQSGETADTLAAAQLARRHGAKVLSVCNSVGSTLTRCSDYNLYTHCGPECGVASTKAFIGQLVALNILALHAAVALGRLREGDALAWATELKRLPSLIEEALKLDSHVLEIAKLFWKAEHFIYIGRTLNYPTAIEGALKLKEISYIHAEGYPAGEMKHGPLALIDENMPVLAIATQSKVFDKIVSNIEEARARGARLISLATRGERRLEGKVDHLLELPYVSENLSPIVNIIPLQLLAYHIANLRGCDVDQPRNLAKSVTVE